MAGLNASIFCKDLKCGILKGWARSQAQVQHKLGAGAILYTKSPLCISNIKQMKDTHPLLQELQARGFIYQCTDIARLNEVLLSASGSSRLNSHDTTRSQKPLAAYIGFDGSARSLHVGNLMQIMILRHLQMHGIKPIALLGGATSKIGDPSGRDTQRLVLSDEDIAQNIAGIKKSLQKFISFDDEDSIPVHKGANDVSNASKSRTRSNYQKGELADNSSWLGKLGYIDLLREVGAHFSINRMINLNKFRERLDSEKHLSFLEFNYPIMQGYDFMHLNKHLNCVVQFGGSDQWGNIVSGVELTKKMNQAEVFGVTTPLITTASGKKMGKSEEGAVWLNEDMLKPEGYYQFWRNCDDQDVYRFMRIYTMLPLKEISDLELNSSLVNEHKKILALHATSMCHGADIANLVHDKAVGFYENKDSSALEAIVIDQAYLDRQMSISLLCRDLGIIQSLSEARRLITSGGIKINGNTISTDLVLHKDDIGPKGVVISIGKKKHLKIKLSD